MKEQTYEEILRRMEQVYLEQAGFVPQADSDLGIRLRVLAGEVYNLHSGILWLNREAFPQTATGERLERHAAQRGITRQGKTSAVGNLIFRREKALTYPLTIPKGTICALAGAETVRFVTTEESELPAYATSVSVPAQAEQGGTQGNVAANTVTVMITPPLGLESVTNTAFTGGGDEESNELLRARLLRRFALRSNGTNRGFYSAFAMGYEGVASANTIASSEEPGKVTVYVCGRTGAVSQTEKAKLQADLNALKEVNVTIAVEDAEEVFIQFLCSVKPAVPYTLSEVSEKCKTLLQEYLETLPIGGTFVAAEMYRRLMNTGMIENYKANSATTDVALAPNQRVMLQSVSLAQL